MSSMRQDRRNGEQEDYRAIDDKAETEERRSIIIMETKKTGNKKGQGDKRVKKGNKGDKDNQA